MRLTVLDANPSFSNPSRVGEIRAFLPRSVLKSNQQMDN